MVQIEPFHVEQWMDEYETTPGVLNIAETCAASLSVDDLVALAEADPANAGVRIVNPLATLSATKLTYGAIRGSDTVRARVAALLDAGQEASPLPADNVVISQGAIAANYLLFYSLIGPGDHVVCVYPTYQQLYGVPASLGAEVSLWRLQAEKQYVPDAAELDGLVRPNTKMIVINNPNNPLGVPIPRATLEAIVAFARARRLLVMADEVYLPLVHGGVDTTTATPPSILALGYDRAVSTGSMSKAFSLAGVRLGWIASRDRAVVDAVLAARDYTTISVSQLDDGVACFALSDAVRRPLLRRNLQLARTNLQLLAAFVERWAARGGVCRWQRPTAGTTAFVQFSRRVGDDGGAEPVDDVQFCRDVLAATKVMMVPGSRCFGGGQDFRGFVRIGYVSETDVLREALEKLDRYVESNLA